MKTCPFCSEEVQEAAAKCRYCGEWFAASAEPEAGSRSAVEFVSLPAAAPRWLERLRSTSTLRAVLETAVGLFVVRSVLGGFFIFPNFLYWLMVMAVVVFGLARLPDLTMKNVIALVSLPFVASLIGYVLTDRLLDGAQGFPTYKHDPYDVSRAITNIGPGAFAVAILAYLKPSARSALRRLFNLRLPLSLRSLAALVVVIVAPAFMIFAAARGSLDFGVYRAYGTAAGYLPPTHANVVRLVKVDFEEARGLPSSAFSVEPLKDSFELSYEEDKDLSHWFVVTWCESGGGFYTLHVNPFAAVTLQKSLGLGSC